MGHAEPRGRLCVCGQPRLPAWTRARGGPDHHTQDTQGLPDSTGHSSRLELRLPQDDEQLLLREHRGGTATKP